MTNQFNPERFQELLVQAKSLEARLIPALQHEETVLGDTEDMFQGKNTSESVAKIRQEALHAATSLRQSYTGALDEIVELARADYALDVAGINLGDGNYRVEVSVPNFEGNPARAQLTIQMIQFLQWMVRNSVQGSSKTSDTKKLIGVREFSEDPKIYVGGSSHQTTLKEDRNILVVAYQGDDKVQVCPLDKSSYSSGIKALAELADAAGVKINFIYKLHKPAA